MRDMSIINKIAVDGKEYEIVDESALHNDDIVHTLGDSQTKVMSQHGVTTQVASEVSRLNVKISKNDKRITNLEKGLPASSWETDTNVAYVKDVPENALPYAAISKIGGMSYKSKNLFGGIALANKIMAEAPTNSVLDTSAKTIKYFAGEIQHKILFSNFKPNTRYTFLLEGSGTASLLNLKITYTDGTIETLGSFSSADTKEPIRFVSSASKSVESLNGEWQSGYTTLYYEKCGIFEGEVFYEDFKPYFSGLRDAKAAEVKSVGANLLKLLEIYGHIAGVLVITNPNANTVTINGTAISSGGRTTKIGQATLQAGTYKLNSQISNLAVSNAKTNAYIAGLNSFTLTEETTVIVGFNFTQGVTYDATGNIWLTKGDVDLPFTPYTEHTLAIPETLLNKEWYGIGIPNTDIYNVADLVNSKGDIKAKKVDLGTLNWTFNGEDIFYITLSDKKLGIPNILCSKYPNANVHFDRMPNNTITGNASNQLVYVKTTDYTDAATFKSAMSGVMLVYELATPTTEDIPEIDNFISVEGGGTLTFENEYGYDVPSEVIYQLGE